MRCGQRATLIRHLCVKRTLGSSHGSSRSYPSSFDGRGWASSSMAYRQASNYTFFEPNMPFITINLIFVVAWFSGKGGLFRNRNFSNVRKFHDSNTVEWMGPALAVRDCVNQLIGRLNTKEWDVSIASNPQDLHILQVRFTGFFTGFF